MSLLCEIDGETEGGGCFLYYCGGFVVAHDIPLFGIRCKSARCKTLLNFINMCLLEKIGEKATYGNCDASVSFSLATEERF